MKLAEYLSAQKLDEAAFASMLGITRKGVEHWVRGRRTPRAGQMQKIAMATNGAVQPNDFVETLPLKIPQDPHGFKDDVSAQQLTHVAEKSDALP